MTLWNDQARISLQEGDSLEIINATSRERYGQVEIQASGFTVLRKSHQEVRFREKITPIEDLKPGMLCSIAGVVTGLGELREFQREDGTAGRVASIYLSDETGRVKAVLWGEHVDLLKDLDLGHRGELIDAQVKSGWNEELEVSCGWRTRITFAPPGK
jgi:replication factor A1